MTEREIPFFKFGELFKEYENDYLQIFREVASRGGFILQKEVDELEEKIKSFINVKYAIGVADCTNAILLGLRALDIGQGDEVIISSHSFVAAAQSIHYVGAIPVPVEPTYDWLIDPTAVEKAITPKTKVVMAVHVNGRICNMDALQKIVEKYGLLLVEDSAQALGAQYKGQCAGTFGKFGCFSFYPSKVLGCFGDGGILTTNDPDVARKVLLMRNHGADPDRNKSIVCWGTNSRLDNIQAAFLSFKLNHFKKHIAKRREIAQRYHEAFCGIKYLQLPPSPHSNPDYFDVYQNYEMQAENRDDLRLFLQERGIGTIVQWGGVALHQMKFLGFENSLPITDKFFAKSLLLPMNHTLSFEEVEYICQMVKIFYS
jgi:dTDP-4-amino-4,6-dideoxygalactose transaminase